MSNNGEKLTTRQQKFSEAYTAFGLNTEGNGILSAIAANYRGSDKSLAATASRTLAMVKVQRVIDGIKAHRQAVLAEKTGFTIDDAQRMYKEDRAFARKCRQSGAAVSATTGICRLYGMDKDANIGEKTIIIISPKVPKVIESKEIVNGEQDV